MGNAVRSYVLLIQFYSILPTKYIITSTISVSAYYNRFVSFREKNNWKKVTRHFTLKHYNVQLYII